MRTIIREITVYKYHDFDSEMRAKILKTYREFVHRMEFRDHVAKIYSDAQLIQKMDDKGVEFESDGERFSICHNWRNVKEVVIGGLGSLKMIPETPNKEEYVRAAEGRIRSVGAGALGEIAPMGWVAIRGELGTMFEVSNNG